MLPLGAPAAAGARRRRVELRWHPGASVLPRARRQRGPQPGTLVNYQLTFAHRETAACHQGPLRADVLFAKLRPAAAQILSSRLVRGLLREWPGTAIGERGRDGCK